MRWHESDVGVGLGFMFFFAGIALIVFVGMSTGYCGHGDMLEACKKLAKTAQDLAECMRK